MNLKFVVLTILLALVSNATGSERNIVAPRFPPNFWWGTSLAAHQAEGGNVNSWTVWESTPGHIKNNDKSGLADDHWNRYPEDFSNLQWLNANTHRMSIEWSRLEPQPGQWNEKAAQHYRQMILNLKSHGIRPVLCLFHFTLPIWVEDAGGFENPQMIQAFVKFAARAQKEFGDLVKDWFTVNEPVVYAINGYADGIWPPGVKDYKRTLKVIANLLRAHALAYHALKTQDPDAKISFAQHLRAFSPANQFSPLDLWGVHIVKAVVNWSWYDAIQSGQIKISIPTVATIDEKCPECVGTLDYVAFNYYSRSLISLEPFSERKFFVSNSNSGPKTDMGWEIYPEGMIQVLKGLKSHGLGKYPILISENGIADQTDKHRALFIYEHLKVFFDTCKELNLEPMGYLHWTLMDNFEWDSGFSPRFGLYSVDYKTRNRTPRPSASYFKQLGAEKILTPP